MLEHAISAFIGIAFVAVSVISSYKVARSFFGSEHARTNTSGDFGSPRGSAFAFLLPAMLCMAVLILISQVLTIHYLGAYVILVLVLGLSSAIYGAFSNRKVDKDNKQPDPKTDDKDNKPDPKSGK